MIDKLKRKFKYEIRYWPRDFITGVKNLIRWFLIVWKDRQWDNQYIYSVLRHKLHLTEQFTRHHGIHINNVEDANKIKKCVILLDRLIEDEYHEMSFSSHYKKWGEPEMNFGDSEDHPDYKILSIDYPNVKTEQDKEKEMKEFRLHCNHEQKLKEQDLDLLFKLIRKHIQSWWD